MSDGQILIWCVALIALELQHLMGLPPLRRQAP
jgi:hypothetical protein